MISAKELGWLAGLIEGEGSFGMTRRSSPSVKVSMSDRDVIERAARLLGGSVQKLRPKTNGKPTYLQMWRVHLHGIRAIQWMMTLYPEMGLRRRAKIREVVLTWRASPRAPRPSRGQKLYAACHPDRRRVQGSLCQKCYMREYRQRRLAVALLSA